MVVLKWAVACCSMLFWSFKNWTFVYHWLRICLHKQFAVRSYTVKVLNYTSESNNTESLLRDIPEIKTEVTCFVLRVSVLEEAYCNWVWLKVGQIVPFQQHTMKLISSGHLGNLHTSVTVVHLTQNKKHTITPRKIIW